LSPLLQKRYTHAGATIIIAVVVVIFIVIVVVVIIIVVVVVFVHRVGRFDRVSARF
jgi:hypothetical protein